MPTVSCQDPAGYRLSLIPPPEEARERCSVPRLLPIPEHSGPRFPHVPQADFLMVLSASLLLVTQVLPQTHKLYLQHWQPCHLFESSKECTHSENFLTMSSFTEYSIGGTATWTTVGGLCRHLQSQKTYWAFTWVFDCPMPLSNLLWHLFPSSHLFPPPPSSKF